MVWAQAQATTGAIQGLVTDPSGAVVAEAKVEAKNLDTNFVRTQDTDTYGRFVLLQMPPGRYTVRVSKPGFATLVQEAVVLTVGEALNLALTMKVSAVEETVTVTDTPLVDSVRTEASSTLNQITVSNTPILGRKFEDLLTLTPGVSRSPSPDSAGSSTTSAWTAAITTTASSASNWAASARRSTSRWRRCASSRWWRRGQARSSAAPRAES